MENTRYLDTWMLSHNWISLGVGVKNYRKQDKGG